MLGRIGLVTVVAALAWIDHSPAHACEQFIVTAKIVANGGKGGIIVYSDASPTKGEPYEVGVLQKQWRFQLPNKREVEPMVEVMAPGLVVYTLPDGVEKATLVDKAKKLATLEAIDVQPLSPPKISAITHAATKTGAETTVSIVGDLPEGVVALVLVDDTGTAMTFGRVDRKKPLVVYTRKPCARVPVGTVEPAVGMKVAAFWVDKFGQASKRSVVKKIITEPSKEP